MPALEQEGPVDWALWDRASVRLAEALPDGPDRNRRIHHLYLPVLFFAIARARQAVTRPLVVGIQAPQGAGKTTLVTHLLDLMPLAGLRAAAVSIDDFYLTRAEQVALAAAHPGNPYLEHRGYPGTHDVAFGASVISQLRALGADATGAGAAELSLPVYDKSAHGGRGDRAPVDAWRRLAAPLDLVFVEGWMLGFEPVPEADLGDPHLVAPNARLSTYQSWIDQLDAFVVLAALDPSFVLTWRVQAEEAMKAAGRPGLDRDAIIDYVRRFLPAYRLYAGRPPSRLASRSLTIGLDDARRPTAAPAGV
jgi:D-glycerate 3-kinase